MGGETAAKGDGRLEFNAVVSDPDFCSSDKMNKRSDAGKNKLPIFVFVAGVEGSGHHALKDVWWALERAGMKLELVVYDQLFHSFGIENHASYHYSSINLDTHIANMKPVFAKASAEDKVRICVVGAESHDSMVLRLPSMDFTQPTLGYAATAEGRCVGGGHGVPMYVALRFWTKL